MLDEAANTLEQYTDPPDAPDICTQTQIVFLPDLSAESRLDRCAEAVSRLRAVIEEVENLLEDCEDADLESELNAYMDEIGGVADELESVEFPGMY